MPYQAVAVSLHNVLLATCGASALGGMGEDDETYSRLEQRSRPGPRRHDCRAYQAGLDRTACRVEHLGRLQLGIVSPQDEGHQDHTCGAGMSLGQQIEEGASCRRSFICHLPSAKAKPKPSTTPYPAP